jgi:hypothetical protein
MARRARFEGSLRHNNENTVGQRYGISYLGCSRVIPKRLLMCLFGGVY